MIFLVRPGPEIENQCYLSLVCCLYEREYVVRKEVQRTVAPGPGLFNRTVFKWSKDWDMPGEMGRIS